MVLVVGSGFGLIGSNLEVGLDFWVWSCCVGFCIWVFFYYFFWAKIRCSGVVDGFLESREKENWWLGCSLKYREERRLREINE